MQAISEKKLILLGSTGSVGSQAVEVARKHGMRLTGISAARRTDVLEAQIREFSPDFCAVVDPDAAKALQIRVADTSTRVLAGQEGILTMLREAKADVVLNSLLGSAGLLPTLTAIELGRDVALANKETLVMAGSIVMERARRKGVRILPVDSEHSAVFQCLQGNPRSSLAKLWLTASGGPFFGRTAADLEQITVAETLAHPTWNMGAKITVDSATMMNKGFEVIEAVHLFGVAPKDVEVVVHRESIVHSMVEYADGAVLAQMGAPDMRTCIQYALTYPDRVPGLAKRLDLRSIGALHFAPPDCKTFPLLPLAYHAIEEGGTLPATLNAANEEAVARFLAGELRFPRLISIVEDAVAAAPRKSDPTVEELMEADAAARRWVSSRLP